MSWAIISELLASAGIEFLPVVEEGTVDFIEENPDQDVIPPDAEEG